MDILPTQAVELLTVDELGVLSHKLLRAIRSNICQTINDLQTAYWQDTISVYDAIDIIQRIDHLEFLLLFIETRLSGVHV